jgi:TetR/AcrR family acrAB operon transcriptional repressor
MAMRRTKEDAEKTRQLILEAASHVFYESGFSGTTLEQIALRAGVTRGAIYWHFKDKLEVLRALHSEISMPQEDLVREAIERGHEDPIGLIESSVMSALRMLAQNDHQQRIYAILTLKCEMRPSEATDRVKNVNAEFYSRLLKLMQMAHHSQMLATGWTAETAARAVQATVNGLLYEWLRSEKSFCIIDTSALLIPRVINSMKATGSPSRSDLPRIKSG